MKFNVDSDDLKEALESLQVKGKHLTNSGFSSSNFGTIFYAKLEDNQLSLYNGEPTFMVKITIGVEEGEDGDFVADSSLILPYLKSFDGQITATIGDYLCISNGRKNANIPKHVSHPHQEALSRLISITSHITYEVQPQTLFAFSNSNFEGAFTKSYSNETDYVKDYDKEYEAVYSSNFGSINYTSVAKFEKAWQKAYAKFYDANYAKNYEGYIDFTKDYNKDYEGTFTGYFEKNFTKTYAKLYTVDYLNNYINTYVDTTNYVGTASTLKLWVRVA